MGTLDQRIIDNAVNSGVEVFALVWLQKAVILNIICKTFYRKRNAVWTRAAFV